MSTDEFREFDPMDDPYIRHYEELHPVQLPEASPSAPVVDPDWPEV